MTIENQRNKKNTHLGEALGKYLPPLTLEEFEKYLKESKGSKFEDKTSRYFIEKYPMIKNDPHVQSNMLLIGLKMLVVEGWQEIDNSKLFYKELERRLKRLFPKYKSARSKFN